MLSSRSIIHFQFYSKKTSVMLSLRSILSGPNDSFRREKMLRRLSMTDVF